MSDLPSLSAEQASVLAWIQRAQVAAGASEDRISLLAPLWTCLKAAPPCEDPAGRTAVSSTILRLAAGTFEQLQCMDANFVDATSGRKNARYARIDSLLALLAHRYTDASAGPSALAATMGVSPCYLSRTVHAVTGHHLTTYRSGLRLLRSAILLRTTNLSIKDIAVAVGYRRTGELDRQFDRWVHMAPSQFRDARHGRRFTHRAHVGATVAEIQEWTQKTRDCRPAEIADVLCIDLGVVLTALTRFCRQVLPGPHHQQHDVDDDQPGRQTNSQSCDAPASAGRQEVAERQPEQPVSGEVPDHRRARVGQAAQNAGGDALQPAEGLKHDGHSKQRHADHFDRVRPRKLSGHE